jgi:hypothetical protein
VTQASSQRAAAPLIDWCVTICQPITTRLLTNAEGYGARYRWWFTATSIAAGLDLATTIRFMLADGIDHELHPAIRITAGLVGPWLGPLLGKLGQLAAIALVTLYARPIARQVFFAATLMYGWAAWYNVWGRDLYAPLLFELLPLHG